MDKMKNFFDKKKLDKRFKKAGTGHTLTSSTSANSHGEPAPNNHQATEQTSHRPSMTQSVESQLAGQAALLRLEKKYQPQLNSISKAARAQAQKELDEEKRALVESQRGSLSSKPSEKQFESAPVLPCVLLVCPFCSNSQPKQTIDNHMLECLKDQLEENPSVVSVTIFLSCNRYPEKLAAGKDIFIRVFNNIINNPDQEKFRKLKCSTNAYKDKIQPMLGHQELLSTAGFTLQDIPLETNSEETESVWAVDGEPKVDLLKSLVSMLQEGEAMKPVLDRQPKLLTPKDVLSVGPVYYPDDFYNLSKEEIAREHQLRRERAEKELQLRTKAMRDRDALQEVRKYNYTLIRIRFPDNNILQLVFRAFEKFQDVLAFVASSVAYQSVPFSLLDATGHSFEEDKFLSDLGLVPAAVLNFHWDEVVLREVMINSGASPDQHAKYLSDEFLSQFI